MNITNLTPSSGAGWYGYNGENNGAVQVIESTAIVNIGKKSCDIDSERAASIYQETSSNGPINLVIAKTDDTSATIQLSNTGSNGMKLIGVQKVDTDKIMTCIVDETTLDIRLETFTLSGVTPTSDATQTVSVGAAFAPETDFTVISPTRAHVSYYNGTNGAIRGVTIGSGTITVDTSEATIDATRSSNTLFENLSSSTSLLCHNPETSPRVELAIVTDGDPLVIGSFVTVFETSESNIVRSFMVNGNKDKGVVIAESGSNDNVALGFTISGSTITVDTDFVDSGITLQGAHVADYIPAARHSFIEDDGDKALWLTATKVTAMPTGRSVYYVQPLIYNSNDNVAQGNQSKDYIDQSSLLDPAIAVVSPTQAILFAENVNSYPTFRVINK